jgi:Gas vesicle synthesis protein GvpL/GvpF
MDGTATYLYCVVHAPVAPTAARAPRGLPGAARIDVTPIARSLWLVTAAVPLEMYGPGVLERSLRDVDWVTTAAVAHEEVVEYFARRTGSTVIPMKLFTMFSSVERAVDDMRPRQQQLSAVVRRIAGCEEWGVRITHTPAVVGRDRATAAAASGTEFLAARKAARDAARRSVGTAAAAAEEAYRTLSAIARDARRRDDVPTGATSPPVLDAAFLVPLTQRSRFKSAVKKLADGADHGTQVVLTGPWPSYNFIQSESGS